MSKNEDKNTKEIKETKSDHENESLNPKNANKYLLSFLLENSDKSDQGDDDPYFKDSDEESNEEQNNKKKNNNSNENNISNNFENTNLGKNISYQNFIENSTIDNSGYNYLNKSQNNNNFLFNSPSSNFNPNHHFYFKNNNSMNFNHYNIQNLFLNSNNNNYNFNNNISNNYFNKISSSNNNHSFKSFNNLSVGNYHLPQSCHSFNGLSPKISLNFSNKNNSNHFPQNLTLNNDNINNNKCLSFNIDQSKEIAKSLGCKVMKYKHSKSQKLSLDEENSYNQSNFNIKKLFEMSVQSLYNYIITQKGSREIQAIIEKLSEKEIDLLICKLKNYISNIIMAKYGNYLIQKLIKICQPYQRIQILDNIKNNFVEIANNTYGTHTLQTLIEIIKLPQEKNIIISYILGNEKVLSLDARGTHILQKIISNTKDEERLELNKNIINILDKLILDPSGVCVLTALVKNTKDISIFQKISNYITKEGPLLFIQHPYANYAVQSLIIRSDLLYCKEIIDTIVQNYFSLSMQKFSSNIVENCIKYGTEETIQKIYKSVIDDEKLESLLNNLYGNYVLEKLFERLNLKEKMIFIKKIEKLGKNKNSNAYKKFII